MDGSMDLPGVYKYAAFMLLFYVSSSLMSYAVNVSMITLSRRITYTLRKDTFNHLVTLPVSFFDGTTTGDILSRISYDIDTINASLSNDVVQVVSSSVTIVGSLVMMLRLSPRLVLVFAVTIPLALLLASYLTTWYSHVPGQIQGRWRVKRLCGGNDLRPEDPPGLYPGGTCHSGHGRAE